MLSWITKIQVLDSIEGENNKRSTQMNLIQKYLMNTVIEETKGMYFWWSCIQIETMWWVKRNCGVRLPKKEKEKKKVLQFFFNNVNRMCFHIERKNRKSSSFAWGKNMWRWKYWPLLCIIGISCMRETRERLKSLIGL